MKLQKVKKKLDELYPLLKSLKVFFKDHFYTYDMECVKSVKAEGICCCKDLMISKESTP